MMLSLSLLMLVQAAAAPTPSATEDIAKPDAARMSVAEVKAFNAGLDPRHAYYIRCRPVKVTGSLVKRGHVCRTNEQWTSMAENGNRQASELVDYARTKPSGQ